MDPSIITESIVSSNNDRDDNKSTLEEGEMWNDIQYDAVGEDAEIKSEHLQSKPSKPANKVTVIITNNHACNGLFSLIERKI